MRLRVRFTHFVHLTCQGDITVGLLLGDIYYKGQGAAIDYARAMAVYKIAAERGDAWCQSKVGDMYNIGEGPVYPL